MSVVYDAGVLVAANRSDRETWAGHRVRLEAGLAPTTTAPVVAQVSRSGRQVQLRRFLRGCVVVPFVAEDAREVGALLDEAGASDVVDAHVVLTAARSSSTVVTADVDDIRRLTDASSAPVRVRRI